jgi:hypothetical protein
MTEKKFQEIIILLKSEGWPAGTDSLNISPSKGMITSTST